MTEKTEAVQEEVKERPEPPKDENGNPIKPENMPEPPKDENGNPLKPEDFKAKEEAQEA